MASTNGKLRILLVLSEEDTRNEITALLNEKSEIDILYGQIEADQLIICNKNTKYDAILTDNIETCQSLNSNRSSKLPNSSFVLMSMHKNLAFDAFEFGATDFLHLPCTTKRLEQTIDKIRKSKKCRLPGADGPDVGIFLKGKDNQYFIMYNQIIYIEANGKHSIVHTVEQSIHTIHLFKTIESRLPGELFQRVHRRFIINLEYVRMIEFSQTDGKYAIMKFPIGLKLPVGRSFSHKFRKCISS